MKVIEQEIHSLKNSISEMWALVHQQLYNAGEAMLTGDKELAYSSSLMSTKYSLMCASLPFV